jgi:septum formation protein
MREMKKKELVLASGSPRRKELLEQIGFTFSVIPSRGEERITETRPELIVQQLAEQKAREVALRTQESDKLILGADTLVFLEGKPMGKPADEKEAFSMLKSLQDNVHQVFTGVAFSRYLPSGEVTGCSFYEETKVWVYPMTDEEIKAYIATGEPMDKAGAYGIQGSFAAFIRRIEGDYNNVVGLPTGRLFQEWKSAVKLLTE